jgi:HEAT repeat protein
MKLRTLLQAASLAGAVTLAACASDPLVEHPANLEIQREITTIIARVKVETGAQLYDDLKRLVAYDIFSIEQVSKLVDDPNARVRSNALWVLAQIQDPERPDLMRRVDRALKSCLDDVEPTVRFEAAAGLASRGDWDVLPVLFDGLESSESGIRFRCHEQLLATTSRDFGFGIDAPPEERAEATARWRAWYEEWSRTRS